MPHGLVCLGSVPACWGQLSPPTLSCTCTPSDLQQLKQQGSDTQKLEYTMRGFATCKHLKPQKEVFSGTPSM